MAILRITPPGTIQMDRSEEFLNHISWVAFADLAHFFMKDPSPRCDLP
jgi:hypothetical protein